MFLQKSLRNFVYFVLLATNITSAFIGSFIFLRFLLFNFTWPSCLYSKMNDYLLFGLIKTA